MGRGSGGEQVEQRQGLREEGDGQAGKPGDLSDTTRGYLWPLKKAVRRKQIQLSGYDTSSETVPIRPGLNALNSTGGWSQLSAEPAVRQS